MENAEFARTYRKNNHENQEDGAPERIRTSDLCLRRAALYPAELRALTSR